MNNAVVNAGVINSRGAGYYWKFFLTTRYSLKVFESCYVSEALSVQLWKNRWSSLEIFDIVQFSSNEMNEIPSVKTKQCTVTVSRSLHLKNI